MFNVESKEVLNTPNYILEHWGIHHLHLNYLEENTKKISPVTNILLVKIQNHNIYFVAIKPHKCFHDEGILKIIDDNWPNLLLKMQMPAGGTICPTNVRKIRQNGWNIVHTVMGVLYLILNTAQLIDITQVDKFLVDCM